MHRVVEVKPLGNFRLSLVFDDGVSGEVDLSHLAGRGVFGIWNNHAAFESVTIGDSGELVWSDQADLCADSLYQRMENQLSEASLVSGIRNAGD